MATNILEYDDLNMLAERITLFSDDEDYSDLLAAWGVDEEALGIFMGEYTTIAAKQTAGLERASALSVAWFSGFALGYLARIETESRELLAVPETLPE